MATEQPKFRRKAEEPDEAKAKKVKKVDYSSEHIEVQSGLSGVRKNASMYMGGTGVDGVYKFAGELLDNGVDEYLAGRNKAVRLHIDKDGSYWVLDQGTGIPQGIKEIHMHVNGKDVINKLPTMQAIFGELHTSGKYRSDAYKTSIGTHGIGSKGTNATSEFFDVVTFFKGSWYSIGFKKGKLVSPIQKLKKAPKGPDGTPLKLGTCIHTKPDPTIYTVKSFPPAMATEWAEVTSYLNPGLAIVISTPKGKKAYLSKKGPIEYVETRITKLKADYLTKEVFEVKSDIGDAVVAFTNTEGTEVRGFTNGLSNKEGGTHVNSLIEGLYDGLCQQLVKAGKDKLVFGKAKKGEKKPKAFKTADLKEGLVGLVNAKLHKAEFSSQDKARLTDARMAKAYVEVVTKAALDFFKANPKVAIMLAERAAKLAALKTNFAMSKKMVTSLNQLKKKGLSANYVPPNKSTKAADREIFIVEGESAGGPAKQARYPHQGVLPIRGKILNVNKGGKKGDTDKGMESEDIMNILASIGYDPKASDPYAKLQTGKIIFLADPDPDGHHINCLLLGLAYKFLPQAFDKGMIYVAKTPEYYAIYKGKLYTADGARALRKKMDVAKVPASVDAIHIKGWGEIDPSVMRILAMNADTRTLIRIEPLKDSDSEFKLLMSESPEERRKLAGFVQ